MAIKKLDELTSDEINSAVAERNWPVQPLPRHFATISTLFSDTPKTTDK